ncbi:MULTISPECIES: hypothetical protein [unclassified Methylobacterium]|uniref:hypothetical protein n=1 Tax=Methylobacterium sp. 88A TaxID=1131813 RepID=UPI001FCCE9FD|nr:MULTISPECIES: hypothetical protein [unclassified Methylobacterium]
MLQANHLGPQRDVLAFDLPKTGDACWWKTTEAPTPAVERPYRDVRRIADRGDGNAIFSFLEQESDFLIGVSASTHVRASAIRDSVSGPARNAPISRRYERAGTVGLFVNFDVLLAIAPAP